jgi:guanylate kinase
MGGTTTSSPPESSRSWSRTERSWSGPRSSATATARCWGPVADALEAGHGVILEIDVQGAARVRERMPDAVLIFLAPPSFEDLVERLRRRHTENEAEMARRLEAARLEMEQAAWFDRVVVNDEVDRAAAELAAIINGTPDPRGGGAHAV